MAYGVRLYCDNKTFARTVLVYVYVCTCLGGTVFEYLQQRNGQLLDEEVISKNSGAESHS